MIYSPIETEGYRKVKANAMAYLQAMKVGSEPGIYKKEACETSPSTYGSYHATQVLSLFGELQKMPRKDLDAWAEHIKALQIGGMLGDSGYEGPWRFNPGSLTQYNAVKEPRF